VKAEMTIAEYFGWVSYFERMNSNEDEKPNLLANDNGDAMLRGFGL